jgi:glycine cleavage system aminomethyltransferase T
MIALASVSKESAASGSTLSMELTVEAARKTVSAKIVPLPFFNPPRKTAAVTL